MLRMIKVAGLPIAGLVIVVIGFIYDILFAGIPYQDPTPEIQARYELHSSVAGLFYKTGGVVLLLGLLAIPLIWIKTGKKGQASDALDSN